MDPLERIRTAIANFAGYDTEQQRGLSDEQIRGLVGEMLSELSDAKIGALTSSERERYDRLLLRAEFMNQRAFHAFQHGPPPERIASVMEADAAVIDAAQACDLTAIERAFDLRDEAMQHG